MGIRLGFSRTDHPVETPAVCADADGHSLAYSADTGPGWSLAALGEGHRPSPWSRPRCSKALGESEAVHRTAAFTGADAKATVPGASSSRTSHPPATARPTGPKPKRPSAGPVLLAAPHERYEAG